MNGEIGIKYDQSHAGYGFSGKKNSGGGHKNSPTRKKNSKTHKMNGDLNISTRINMSISQ